MWLNFPNLPKVPKLSKNAQSAVTSKVAETANFAAIAKIAGIANIFKTANIPETEKLKFLETFKIRVFYEKMKGFFEKKLEIQSKLLKGANLFQNANQMVLFPLNVFRPISEVFWQKSMKI